MRRKSADEESIYLDLRGLLKVLCMAGYEMEAKDRILWLDDAKQEAKQCLRLFIRAYDALDEGEKVRLFQDMKTEFAVLVAELSNMDEEHVWRGRKDKDGNSAVAKQILDFLGRIDEGISKWQWSLLKGRVPPEMEDGVC